MLKIEKTRTKNLDLTSLEAAAISRIELKYYGHQREGQKIWYTEYMKI